MEKTFYFTCMEDVAKKLVARKIPINWDDCEDGCEIEVYSTKETAINMRHPADTWLVVLKLDESALVVRHIPYAVRNYDIPKYLRALYLIEHEEGRD